MCSMLGGFFSWARSQDGLMEPCTVIVQDPAPNHPSGLTPAPHRLNPPPLGWHHARHYIVTWYHHVIDEWLGALGLFADEAYLFKTSFVLLQKWTCFSQLLACYPQIFAHTHTHTRARARAQGKKTGKEGKNMQKFWILENVSNMSLFETWVIECFCDMWGAGSCVAKFQIALVRRKWGGCATNLLWQIKSKKGWDCQRINNRWLLALTFWEQQQTVEFWTILMSSFCQDKERGTRDLATKIKCLLRCLCEGVMAWCSVGGGAWCSAGMGHV